ncbi:SDR family NAD(P)-dependent oxidoreductase [Micromonospora sp. NPDC047557]|uniref:SDR family NAD(P)-dependent oxidoreductase n=1 Tax=Micromonospora sp. NPDC047557 TaxID=3364250 RepID=UPI00371E35A6
MSGAVRLAATGEDIYGRIDTWVNAATVSVWGRVEDITDEEFDRVLRGNFLGQVYGAHAVLPALRRRLHRRLVRRGVRAVPLHDPYTVSKRALRRLRVARTDGVMRVHPSGVVICGFDSALCVRQRRVRFAPDVTCLTKQAGRHVEHEFSHDRGAPRKI